MNQKHLYILTAEVLNHRNNSVRHVRQEYS